MESLFQKYEDLEKSVSSEYHRLISYTNNDIDIVNYNENPTINITDEIFGGSFQIYVLKFNTDGSFRGLDAEDETESVYEFGDIYSLLDKIEVFSILEKIILQNIGNIIHTSYDFNLKV